MNKPIPRSTAEALQRGLASNSLVISADALGSTQPSSVWSAKHLNRFQIASLIFLGWTAVGLFQAASEMLTSTTGWRAVLLDKVFDAWAWAMLTPALIFIDRKLALGQTSVIRSILLFLFLSVPVTLVHTYLTALPLYPFSEVWWSPLRSPGYVIFYFLGGWAVYCALIGILQALRFYNNYMTGQLQLERVQKSLVESRLIALRLHLEPHFLFNALNAISSEVGENPKLAREMIGDLGALLRRSLDCKNKNEIALAQELVVLEQYLAIQRVRFGDRISFDVEVEPEMLTVNVPSMLLQPLLENSIRHGVEGLPTGGTVCVSAARLGEYLEIRVSDDGSGLPPDWHMESATGHGIRVTRERLAALYPEEVDNCFSVERRAGGGTEVLVRIPIKGGLRDGAVV